MKTYSADTESAATGNLWPKQPTQSAMQGLWAARVNQSMAKTYNRYAHTHTGRFCKWPNAGSTAFSITLTHSAIEAGLGATVLELWSPGSTSSMTEVQQQIRHSFFFSYSRPDGLILCIQLTLIWHAFGKLINYDKTLNIYCLKKPFIPALLILTT